MRSPVRSVRARPSSGRRLAVLLIASALFPTLSNVGATAQTTSSASDVATLRAQADAIAGAYFRALSRSHELDDQITQNAQAVNDLEAKAKDARRVARERALLAYTSSSAHLATLIDGKSLLDTARRAQLINNVNARDNAVYTKLKATTQELRATRKALDDARSEQANVLAQIQGQAQAIDAKLAEAEQKERAAEAAAAVAVSAQANAAATTTPPTTAARATTPTPTTTAPTRPTTPTTPPSYTPTPGTHPHHDDPFLTCVRLRESGGNYSAVNPAGPYLGAYQFYQSTWNAAANHAGRPELIGVPANTASPYDQDDVAWSLYQWQGSGPWGGCP